MTDIEPAEVFPLASYLWEEMEARGWTTDDVAMRMPAANGYEAGINLLTVMMVLAVQRDGCLIGDELFAKLAAAFDVSEDLFRNLDATWRKWPDRRAPFDCPDKAYGPMARNCFPKPH